MDVLPQIMLYMIGTFLNFGELTRLSLTSKHMNKRAEEPKKMLAKRELMRLFSSDLDSFRMIIHSVSYELGPQDYSTPTLNDGHDWQNLLREGLIMKSRWPLKLKDQLSSISTILQSPENNLPSFHKNSFSKLESTMQENLFEILGSTGGPKSEFGSNQIEVEFGNFNNLESIYLLYANYYKHSSNSIQNSPRISDAWVFHHELVELIKYYWRIHKISILWWLDEDRPLQFLYEYAVRWSAYSNSLWKLSAQLATFERNFNVSYSKYWPETDAQFRIFRMMTQIWGEVVNDEEMVTNLKDCLNTVLCDYHKDIIQHIRDKAVRKDTVPMSAVLKKFFQMLVDTSINEKSVHFINSTKVEFDSFYRAFEGIILKNCNSFIKAALEVGYKSKNLMLVYSIFEEYSLVIKSFLPHISQKTFEKSKTEIVIKFIRFILCTRLKQFPNFDFSKIESKWDPSHETTLNHVFGVQDSVFLKHFVKVVQEKNFDKLKFQKYWLIMTGQDSALLRKFYDNSLMYLDKFQKSLSAKDAKIIANKQKKGIELSTDPESATLTSLLNPVPDWYVEKLFQDYLGGYERRSTRSFSHNESKPAPRSALKLTTVFIEEKKMEESTEAGEDRDTQDCSESPHEILINEFSQIFKTNQQCWEERAKSMKKNTLSLNFQTMNLERRASM